VYFSNQKDLCNGNHSDIEASIASVNDNNIISKLNEALADPLNQFDISTILGGLRNDSNGGITGGSALLATMLHEKSNSISEEVHKAWEQEFLDYINSLDVSFKGFSIDFS
jgi:hypothetical protein